MSEDAVFHSKLCIEIPLSGSDPCHVLNVHRAHCSAILRPQASWQAESGPSLNLLKETDGTVREMFLYCSNIPKKLNINRGPLGTSHSRWPYITYFAPTSGRGRDTVGVDVGSTTFKHLDICAIGAQGMIALTWGYCLCEMYHDR